MTTQETVRTRQLALHYDPGTGIVERIAFPELSGVNAALSSATAPYPDEHNGFLLGNLRIGAQRGQTLHALGAENLDRLDAAEGGVRMSWDAAGVLAESTFRPEGPDILWDVAVANAGPGALSLRRVALPLAFNNWYHGYGADDAGLERLYENTFYIHRRPAGPASAVYVQRLIGTGPDLALAPEPGTTWAFSHFARWSITRYTSLVQWEGIPLLYLVASDLEDAARESREHRGPRDPVAVAPGETARFGLRFLRVEHGTALAAELAKRGRTVPDVVPGLTSPVDLPLRIATTGETTVEADANAAVEPDPLAPAASSRVLVRWREPGEAELRVTQRGHVAAHLSARVVAPLGDLIRRRAAFIVEHQVHREPGHVLDAGIFLWNDLDRERYTFHADYWGPGCYEGGICDALFLAEKNGLLPDREEIEALEAYALRFLWGRLQNPANFDVAWYFAAAGGGAMKTGRCYNYSHVINFYHAMYRIGARYGLTAEDARLYLERAASTALRMFDIGWRYHLWASGMMGMSRVYDVLADLEKENLADQAIDLRFKLDERADRLLALRFPYASECEYDTTSYEDVYFTARRYNDFEQMRRIVSCVLAARHLSTTWYAYASDKRWWDAMEARPFRWVGDRGENCLHYTTASNSLVLLADLEEEQFIPDPRLAAAGYGGLLGPWALVRDDGFAAMCYCPDPASDHYGFNHFTGDVGLNLYCTLRGLKSYIVHPRNGPPEPYGCELRMVDDTLYEVVPRDGVRREVVFTAPRMRVQSDAFALDRVAADRRQCRFEADVTNPSPRTATGTIEIDGLWGTGFTWTVDGDDARGVQEGGVARVRVELPGGGSARIVCSRSSDGGRGR